jgi:hypothetical protein
VRRLKVHICAIIWCLLQACEVHAQTSPVIAYQLRVKDFEISNSAQLLVTADIPSTSGKTDIQFVAPPGFAIEPARLGFDPQPGKRIVAVTVRRTTDVPTSDYSILARATVQPSTTGSLFAIDQIVTFTYTNRLQIKFYFVLGLIGFILGYLLRIVTGVLKKIPPPAPLQAAGGGGGGNDGSEDGPVTTFVKKHYYVVDFLVSLVLAFIVLLYLMREGHPPDSASAWYGALLTGIGLGFLTNNDLLARIKT